MNSGLDEQVSVAVRAGWSAYNDWSVVGPKGKDLPAGIALRFYTVANLFKNPSSFAGGLMTPAVGPTASDLVQAIAKHSAWVLTTPTDTFIDGYPAKHIQMTIPQHAVFDSRAGAPAFYLFQAQGSGQIWGWAPGQVFDIYAVDVNGQRLVIDAFHYPGTPRDDLASMQAVIATIQIGARP